MVRGTTVVLQLIRTAADGDCMSAAAAAASGLVNFEPSVACVLCLQLVNRCRGLFMVTKQCPSLFGKRPGLLPTLITLCVLHVFACCHAVRRPSRCCPMSCWASYADR
jgi:hypothetical protein